MLPLGHYDSHFVGVIMTHYGGCISIFYCFIRGCVFGKETAIEG